MRPNFTFGPIDSVTQYLLYLSIVVLGILLPLAVQRWVKRRQDRQLLEGTRTALAAEVAANRARVARSQESFAALAAHLDGDIAAYRALWDAAAQPSGDSAPPQPPPPIDLTVAYATTIRTAWDTANFRQALPLMPAASLARYSRAYQLQRALEEHRAIFLAAAMRASALEAPSDLSVARNVERRIETLLELQAFAQHHAGLSRSLVDAYDETLADAG
ncbi:MAG: hypothetical protein OEX23_03175 [Betaproteobacteria bacterium]|nr:hypothetical protein [Betaproteobacteria bacterium]